MHYGEFRIGHFVSLAEREALGTLSDTGDVISRKPVPVDSKFPLPLPLALVAITIATIALALWLL